MYTSNLIIINNVRQGNDIDIFGGFKYPLFNKLMKNIYFVTTKSRN